MPGRALQPTPSLRGVDILLPMVCYTKEARGKSPWASCLFHASMEPPVGCLAYVVRDMPTPTCQLRVEKHHHFVDIIFMHRMFARQFTSVRSHLVSTFERIIPQCQVLQNVYSNPLLCPPPLTCVPLSTMSSQGSRADGLAVGGDRTISLSSDHLVSLESFNTVSATRSACSETRNNLRITQAEPAAAAAADPPGPPPHSIPLVDPKDTANGDLELDSEWTRLSAFSDQSRPRSTASGRSESPQPCAETEDTGVASAFVSQSVDVDVPLPAEVPLAVTDEETSELRSVARLMDSISALRQLRQEKIDEALALLLDQADPGWELREPRRCDCLGGPSGYHRHYCQVGRGSPSLSRTQNVFSWFFDVFNGAQ